MSIAEQMSLIWLWHWHWPCSRPCKHVDTPPVYGFFFFFSCPTSRLYLGPTCAFSKHVWRQGQAEFYLEKLHGEVEKQLEPFLKNQKTPEEWKKYRETLIGLTDVTHSHFDKLVQVSHTSLPRCCLHVMHWPSSRVLVCVECTLEHHFMQMQSWQVGQTTLL